MKDQSDSLPQALIIVEHKGRHHRGRMRVLFFTIVGSLCSQGVQVHKTYLHKGWSDPIPFCPRVQPWAWSGEVGEGRVPVTRRPMKRTAQPKARRPGSSSPEDSSPRRCRCCSSGTSRRNESARSMTGRTRGNNQR